MTFGRLGVLGSLGKLYGSSVGGGAFSWTNAEGAAFEAQADGTGWDDALRGDIDQLISDLKSGQVNGSNTYSGFDRILLMDLPNQADSLRYLNEPSLTAMAVSSPVFTAGEGFTGNGSAAYIDTGYNPSADGGQYIQNSASMGSWVRTASSISGRYFGAADASNVRSEIAAGQADGPNGGSIVMSAWGAGGSGGLFGANRAGANSQQTYTDGLLGITSNNAGSAVTNSPFYILARNANGTPDQFVNGQVSICFVGRSFTANEWEDIYDAFNRYRTAREAA